MEGSLRLMLSSGYSQGKSTVKWNPAAYKKYEYGHLGLWYVKLTLCKRFLNWNKILSLKKVVTGEPSFFVIDAFCTHRSILTLAFDMAVLYGNDSVSILVLSNKKRHFHFPENLLQSIEIVQNFHRLSHENMPTCQSLKRRVILKWNL